MTLLEVRRLDQGGKIGRVVDVEVSEEDGIELGHVRSGTAELQGAAAAAVDQHPRLSILPYEVAGRGALIFELRAARSQHLELDTLVSTSCRRGDAKGECCVERNNAQ